MIRPQPAVTAATTAAALLLAGCWNPGETADSKAAAAEAARSGSGTAPYVQAHSLQALMVHVVDPAAQTFWRSSGTVTDGAGVRDLTPTTDAGWAATRSAAATVTEMGNLMMTPLYTRGRGQDWLPLSQALVQAGMKAEQAAANRDGAAVFDMGGTLYEACSACHQAYAPDVDSSAVTGR